MGVLRTTSAVVMSALLLGGCASTEAGVPGLRAEADAAFVSGNATVQIVSPENRGDPVDGLSGATLDGTELDVADLRGQLVVVNVWGSWCPPCHDEAPDLVQAQAQLAQENDPVAFVGINIRDHSTAAAQGFEEEYGIDWPSLHDPNSLLLLTLAGEIPPQSVPSTLVLDREGRVAARVLNSVTASTLLGVVEDVAATA